MLTTCLRSLISKAFGYRRLGFVNWLVLLRFLSILPEILGRPCALLVPCRSFSYVMTSTGSLQMWPTLPVEFAADIDWGTSFVVLSICFQFFFRWNSNIWPISWNVAKCSRSLGSDASISTLTLPGRQLFQICDIWLILILWGISTAIFCLSPWIWFLRIRILIWAHRSLALVPDFFHFLILVRNSFLGSRWIPLLRNIIQNIILKHIRWVHVTGEVASGLLHILILLNSYILIISCTWSLFLHARAFSGSAKILEWLGEFVARHLHIFIIHHLFGQAILIVNICHGKLLVYFWGRVDWLFGFIRWLF